MRPCANPGKSDDLLKSLVRYQHDTKTIPPREKLRVRHSVAIGGRRVIYVDVVIVAAAHNHNMTGVANDYGVAFVHRIDQSL